MSYIAEFKEAQLPPTTNAMVSWHWTKKARLSEDWNFLVMCHLKKPKKPLQRARLTLVRHSSREPDYDGLVSSFKVVIDALRHNGILIDDRKKNIGQSIYDWKQAKPKQGYITVRVEEIEEGAQP